MKRNRSWRRSLRTWLCVWVVWSVGIPAAAQEDAASDAREVERADVAEEGAAASAEPTEAERPAEPPVEEEVAPAAAAPSEALEASGTDASAEGEGSRRDQQKVEEIVITGSRIRTNPLETPAPVLNVMSEDIDRTGLTSIADVLQRMPVSGGALNTKFNSSGNFGFPPDGGGIGAGAAQIDLRYLGSKRALVLVDGIRWVNGASASGVATATDLNTIPTSIIDRVEVLEDGASSIYGSDAIAGVVNIITKKDFEGFAANVQLGGYHYGDGLMQQYDLSWGNITDRLSVFVNLSYVNQAEALAVDRDISKSVTPNVQACTRFCSSGTPQGRFAFFDANTGRALDLTINDGVGGVPGFDPHHNDADGQRNDQFHGFETADRFNFGKLNLIQTPSERFGMFSQLRYELTPSVNVQVKALYNNRKSKNEAAPEPLFIGPDAGNGNRLDTISVHSTNPYNPFGYTLDSATNPYFFGRRPLEAGTRIFKQNVNTWYLSGGLNGSFGVGEQTFYWDATLVYSQNLASQIKKGGFNSAKLQKALGPLDECLAEPGCVPFNFFGGQGADGQGTLTREMLDYVTFIQKDVSQQDLFDFTANVSGGIVDLPGGVLGVAAGVEHRVLHGFFQPDSVVVAGDTAGVPSSPTSGGYYVTEGYAEVVVPIVKEIPGLDQLDVSGSVRISRYSTFGTEETYKVGLRWRPVEDLMLRSNFGQGFRAPGIGELFGSAARFDQTIDDPCSDMRGRQGGEEAPPEVIANCIGRGVPESGDYEQVNPQISVTTGGNDELEPETSTGLTVGLVYSPSWAARTSWIDQLHIEVTYYYIELENAIQAIDAQVQLDLCAQTNDDAFCGGISRTPTGIIDGFANQLTNIGGIETDGLDVNITYLSPNTSIGRLRVMWLSNFLFRFTQKIPSSEGYQDVSREGTEVGDPEQAYPEFKSSLTIAWALDEWSASFTTRYIHQITEPCRNLQEYRESHGLCSAYNLEDDSRSTNKLDPTVYNDIQVNWSPSALEERLTITLGVNNIFDVDPPVCYSCALNGFDATTYDIPGIYGYLRMGYRM